MKDSWDLIIRPKNNILSLNFRELWQYRDLLSMFVRRDIVTVYKQTILGPIWYFLQPLLTMLVYVVVFANIAGISTDGIPQALFYLSGIIIWNYFSECFMQTSDTFSQNQDMFGKVYFPRLILPLSKVVSGLIKFFIQFLLFVGFYLYFLIIGTEIAPNIMFLITVPLLLIQMAALGLGLGLIFTSLTTKYRDLKFLVQFGVQLLMYATPIIYPISTIPDKFKIYILLNPLSHIVETFKLAFLGKGEFLVGSMIYSLCFTLVILLIGILIFNKTERSFMDTV
jgi:lipopolysaccharide transport system permease protein